MKRERITYPDLLRIAAIFFVILIHVTSVGLHDYAVGTATWVWSGILSSVSHWAVPVFFMVSGMFFLDPEKSFDLNRFYRKNIGRILLCIAVWGFFYSLLDQYIYGTVSSKSVLIAVYGIITGSTGYHLWFLYTLLVLYIATPIVRVFTTHATKKQIDYALLMWFVLGITVWQVNELAQEIFGISNLLPYRAVVLTGYAGYYLLGYRLKMYPLSHKMRHLICACGAAMLLIMPLTGVWLSMRQNTWISAISSQLSIGQCIIATAAFSIAQQVKINSKKISWIGQRVFGVYLVHVFFVSFLFRILELKLNTLCPPILIFGYSIAVFAISLLLSWTLSIIPGVRKIV